MYVSCLDQKWNNKWLWSTYIFFFYIYAAEIVSFAAEVLSIDAEVLSIDAEVLLIDAEVLSIDVEYSKCDFFLLLLEHLRRNDNTVITSCSDERMCQEFIKDCAIKCDDFEKKFGRL